MWYHNHRRKEVDSMTTKRFQYKGQQVNYYNKIKQNTNIVFLIAGLNAQGYYVSYEKAFNKNK